MYTKREIRELIVQQGDCGDCACKLCPYDDDCNTISITLMFIVKLNMWDIPLSMTEYCWWLSFLFKDADVN